MNLTICLSIDINKFQTFKPNPNFYYTYTEEYDTKSINRHWFYSLFRLLVTKEV